MTDIGTWLDGWIQIILYVVVIRIDTEMSQNSAEVRERIDKWPMSDKTTPSVDRLPCPRGPFPWLSGSRYFCPLSVSSLHRFTLTPLHLHSNLSLSLLLYSFWFLFLHFSCCPPLGVLFGQEIIWNYILKNIIIIFWYIIKKLKLYLITTYTTIYLIYLYTIYIIKGEIDFFSLFYFYENRLLFYHLSINC